MTTPLITTTETPPSEPEPDCAFCPRLVEFRTANAAKHPSFHNAPVPSFGPTDARILVVGLAPGLKGANQTGRPFTGDYAGDLLYASLQRQGLAKGSYEKHAEDGLELVGCRITNAVRCVPPQNKPTPAEIKTCSGFLRATLNEMAELRVVLALGKIAHDSMVRGLDQRPSRHPFGHRTRYDLELKSSLDALRSITLISSYHCSRYNTQTGRLTEAMFDEAVADAVMAAR